MPKQLRSAPLYALRYESRAEKENVYTIKGYYQDFDRRSILERLKQAWEYYWEE